MLPQPPASVETPPASGAARLSRRKCGWLMVGGVLSVLGCLFVAAAPFVFHRRCGCGSPGREAIHDLRQLGLALFEFETEYGRFPDVSTIDPVREATGSTDPMGIVSSNDYFRQLFAAGIVSSESMFHVRVPGARLPDDVVTPGEALKKGECSFTYLLGALITDNPARPLVVAPMIPGTNRFDREFFEGKATILRMDNSVVSLEIDKHGQVILQGRNLMDPSHPVWDGHPPAIAWPDL